jgi:hypothetical protein
MEAGRARVDAQTPVLLLLAARCCCCCGSLVLVVVPAALLYVWVGSVERVTWVNRGRVSVASSLPLVVVELVCSAALLDAADQASITPGPKPAPPPHKSPDATSGCTAAQLSQRPGDHWQARLPRGGLYHQQMHSSFDAALALSLSPPIRGSLVSLSKQKPTQQIPPLQPS